MKQEDIAILINTLVEKTGLPLDFGALSYEPTSNTLWCTFNTKGEIPRRFFDEILGAVNHLSRRIIETKYSDRTLLPSLIVDIGGSEKKRIENLRAVAHMMAERSKFFKSNIELDPMSAGNRRIVHEFLAGRPNIRTNSIGDGPSRRVVIEYYEE